MSRISRVPPHERFKADMYSLGIVFFEMSYFFNTGAERINVLENLRSPGIFFPDDWDPLRTRQQQSKLSGYKLTIQTECAFAVITSLLQHDPVQRPSAFELSHSPLLPPLLQDDSFKRSLGMIGEKRCFHLAGPSNLRQQRSGTRRTMKRSSIPCLVGPPNPPGLYCFTVAWTHLNIRPCSRWCKRSLPQFSGCMGP